jgi:ABC-type glycerol-3-phosphate transport system substrate-binding protein
MLLVSALVFLLPLALAFSSGQGDSGSAAKPAELAFTSWGQEANIKSFNELVAQFENEYPHIKVNFEQVPHNQYYELIDVRIAGGKAPDVMRITYGQFGKYKENKVTLDVTDRIKEAKMFDDIPEVFWAFPRYDDGKYYGVPHHTDTIGTFYNVEYAKKAGVTMPTELEDSWTLDEFIAVGKKMRDANGLEYAFSSYTRHPKSWESILYAMDGSILNDAKTESTFNNAAGVRAIQWTADTFLEGLTPVSVLWKRVDSNDQVFAAGQIALNISGQWMIEYLKSNMTDYTFDVTFMPKDKHMSSDFGGNGFMIAKDTKYPAAAWEFMAFLVNEDSMEKFCEEGGYIPARKSVQEVIEFPINNEYLQVFLKQYTTVRQRMVEERAHPKYSAIQNIHKEEIELACLGEKSAKEAADAIVQRINELLD